MSSAKNLEKLKRAIIKKLPNIKKLAKVRARFLVVAAFGLVLFGGVYRFYKTSKLRQPARNKPKFSQIISVDRTLRFPAILSNGKYGSEIALAVVSVEKTNEVFVQNKPVRAKAGKFFIIVNLELENDSTERLGLVSSDLIRLRIGEKGRRIAPDLHNRQVLVAPVSVKSDKVGFVVTGPQDIALTLELGEFYRTKKVREEIELRF